MNKENTEERFERKDVKAHAPLAEAMGGIDETMED
jgi:hypothetical protein